MKKEYLYDIAIVGGLGHVGLPLGIMLAHKGKRVCLVDVDQKKAEQVRRGEMPFIEYGAEPLLAETLKRGGLDISLDSSSIADARQVIIAIGTPVDEYLNPKTRTFLEFFDSIAKYLNPEQLIVIRSTVYPKTCEQIERRLGREKGWKIAYCPERIMQGYAIQELVKLPQVIAGLSKSAEEEAAALFSVLSPKIIHTTMGEAELIKLFTNSWRYMQLAAFNGNNFLLGHAAMME